MKRILGKPNALKQVNLSLVRKVLREMGSATRAEIVEATKISGTTVRTLLSELLENHEIIEGGYDASIGGRKAVRYLLQKDHNLGVALCLGSTEILYATVNVCGELCEKGSAAAGQSTLESVFALLDRLFAETQFRSIGIGVPGVVTGLSYERKNAEGQLEYDPIGELVHARYGVPVLLENDLNAITLGFGRCYLKQFPEEGCASLHLAYLHFDHDCLSAGFLANGRILRGWNNYVGELGVFPVDSSRTLDDLLASGPEDVRYADLVAKLIAGICCVLNPQYVAIGGSCFRKSCLPLITEAFYGTLPDKMSPEILYSGDCRHDYLEGMAYLTAEHIFAEVKLIKE